MLFKVALDEAIFETLSRKAATVLCAPARSSEQTDRWKSS
jgi:hypothetical protein